VGPDFDICSSKSERKNGDKEEQTMQKVLVYLANGTQGGAVARCAIAQGFHVRALVRQENKSHGLAAMGAEIARGDLMSGDGLREAHDGVNFVVMQMPLGAPADVEVGMRHALAAIVASGVQGVVVKMPSASATIATTEPSLVANARIEAMLREAAIPYAMVRPTMYLDNLLRPDIRRGLAIEGKLRLPLAETQRVAWTSVEDAAKAAIAIVKSGALVGDYLVSGCDAVDGVALAARFSMALKREVQYERVDLSVLEREVDARMGAGVGRKVSSKFRFFEAHPEQAQWMLARAFDESNGPRGFIPESLDAWIARHAESFQTA
jgi:uncharacterized protein YbjT (DUF2867 family)